MANLDMNNEKLSRCILHNELYFHQWVNLTKSQQKYKSDVNLKGNNILPNTSESFINFVKFK